MGLSNEEKIKKMKEMFNVYHMKLSILQSANDLDKTENDQIVKSLMEFFPQIEKTYLDQWNDLEEALNVIKHLEESIVDSGGDLDKVREDYINK